MAIKIQDGTHTVELTREEMHQLFSAVEDYSDEYPQATIKLKLLKVYHLPGSDS